LDRSRRQRHHRLALLPIKPQVRGLLGGSRHSRLVIHFFVAHPLHVRDLAQWEMHLLITKGITYGIRGALARPENGSDVSPSV
jgi:hypothetical protein